MGPFIDEYDDEGHIKNKEVQYNTCSVFKSQTPNSNALQSCGICC